MKEYIVEETSDFSFDPKECPISAKVRETWFQYITDNPILENGQMVLLNLSQDVKEKIFDYCQRILVEFIDAEKRLNQCLEMKNKYIEEINNINNTNTYVKNTTDIIINMDKANKYIWNIAKTMVNDDLIDYKKYIEWRNTKTNIDKKIEERWKLIYKIRCEIEHPQNIKTTSFTKVNGGSVIPQIIYNNNNYDLFDLAYDSIRCVYVFFKAVMGASFLYSKYLIAFTDESRTIIYGDDK